MDFLNFSKKNQAIERYYRSSKVLYGFVFVTGAQLNISWRGHLVVTWNTTLENVVYMGVRNGRSLVTMGETYQQGRVGPISQYPGRAWSRHWDQDNNNEQRWYYLIWIWYVIVVWWDEARCCIIGSMFHKCVLCVWLIVETITLSVRNINKCVEFPRGWLYYHRDHIVTKWINCYSWLWCPWSLSIM
jgi:hypothetical protein